MIFKDCLDRPEMVVVPAGSFAMAWKHEVNVARAFAVGRFEVTFADWDRCAAAGGCASNPAPSDLGVGRGRNPVVNVSWRDAQEYLAWLTSKTGNALSVAERRGVGVRRARRHLDGVRAGRQPLARAGEFQQRARPTRHGRPAIPLMFSASTMCTETRRSGRRTVGTTPSMACLRTRRRGNRATATIT